MRKKILILVVSSIMISLAFMPSLNADVFNLSIETDTHLQDFDNIYNKENNRLFCYEEGDYLWDAGYGVRQTNDNGYIITGRTNAFGRYSKPDIWLLKTDSSGNEIWKKTYGGGDWLGRGKSIQITSDVSLNCS